MLESKQRIIMTFFPAVLGMELRPPTCYTSALPLSYGCVFIIIILKENITEKLYNTSEKSFYR